MGDDTVDRAASGGGSSASRTSEAHLAVGRGRLNQVRAGVLGADDGVVSVAGIVIGVAGATSARGPIFTAGLAGLVAGAVSMALGEYMSVSSQRDSETAQVEQERRELAEAPEQELAELAAMHRAKGLTAATATLVAGELTEHDALAAHLDTELRLDPADIAKPVQAAAVSAASFTLGALLPLLSILLSPQAWRVPVTFAAALAALAIAGVVSARIGGALGLTLTYAIGHLVGTVIR
ncbi:VIT1/CCC1 transporter family protein [Catenulispora yoronensis]